MGQPLGRLGLSTCYVVEGVDGEEQASQAMAVMVVPDMHMGVSGRIWCQETFTKLAL